MAPLVNAASFLTSVIFNTFIGLLLLRFIFQLVKADFYNPISQFMVKMTNPMLISMRRIIPSVAGIDAAALVLLLLVQTSELLILMLLSGASIQVNVWLGLGLSIWSIGEILGLTISIYSFSTIILVILSWVPTHGHNPVIALLNKLINPVLAPISSKIKPIAGLDLAPFIFLILLQTLMIIGVSPLISFGKVLMLGYYNI